MSCLVIKVGSENSKKTEVTSSLSHQSTALSREDGRKQRMSSTVAAISPCYNKQGAFLTTKLRAVLYIAMLAIPKHCNYCIPAPG